MNFHAQNSFIVLIWCFNAFYNFMNHLFRCCFGNKDYFYTMINEMYRSMRNMKSQKMTANVFNVAKSSGKQILLFRHVCFWYNLDFSGCKNTKNYYYKNISWPLFYKSLSRVRINNWNLFSSKNILWTIFTWSDKELLTLLPVL